MPVSLSPDERTLILLKPDAVSRHLVGVITARFEQAGLDVVAMKMLVPSRGVVGQHYSAEDIGARHGEAVRQRLIGYMTSGRVVAMVLQGVECVRQCRKLAGATDPVEAAAGTIRGDLGGDSLQLSKLEERATRNLVHASATVEEAVHEIILWFPELA